MKESEIQKQIMDYLAARQVLAFRMNSGAVKIDTRFLRFGVPGMADILSFPDLPRPDITIGGHGQIYQVPSVMWIEVKTSKGIQSEYQKSFQDQVESHGHLYILARSVDDVVEVI